MSPATWSRCPNADARPRLPGLDEPLRQHRMRDLLEGGDVGPHDEVARASVALGRRCALPVDAVHDHVQARVHFLEGPVQALGVLAHLQRTGGHATGVGGLGGAEGNVVVEEGVHGLGSRWHVGPFAHRDTPVVDQHLGRRAVDLVLGRAGERYVTGDGPDASPAIEVLGGGVGVGVLPDPAALHLLDALDGVELDAVVIDDITAAVGQRHDLRPEGLGLLRGVDGHIAGAGDHDPLPFPALAQ
eukprot:TRINITY_DN26471_c0_g1_i1.p5 TRINITY_DN26471_c0_g1~~TRINITY_DN26471_c0_g1_i1.p5  ORF type:complete len:244 (+),score=28.09 TRINITY_DN26471_c0_g1_i1:753-1484(+)